MYHVNSCIYEVMYSVELCILWSYVFCGYVNSCIMWSYVLCGIMYYVELCICGVMEFVKSCIM